MKDNSDSALASVPQGRLEGKLVEAEEGHELIVQALAANGVDCLFFCGGTDNFMFMESVKKFEALKRPHPNLYTCLHESVAVYAAYGYYMVTGKPQAVILHVDCGTLNAGGAWVNSWHGNAGIVVMAGRAPWTSQGELPGSRNGGVYYTQETRDQGSIVRQYVKWDFELKTAKNAGLVMQRAFRIASSEPCGPVYITLPRETLLQKLDGGKGLVYGPESYAPAISPQGDLGALRAAAKLLAEAQNPVISVKRMGRHPESVKFLVELAEKLAIPVIHSETTFINFPFDHPLIVPFSQSQSYIEKADVILFIDQIVPWVSSNCTPAKDCKIITLDIDPIRLAQPTWDFPVHLPITCDSSKAVPVLSRLAEEFITSQRKEAFGLRLDEMLAKAKASAAVGAAAVEKAKSARTISPPWLGACVNEIIDDNTIVVQGIASGITPGPKSRPGQYFGIPASSLGWAMPAGIGAKLAAPNKTIISASGDGSTVFANPEACLWMERRYKIPTLHIVTNNSRYAAVSYSLLRTYADGYCVNEKDYNGYDLSPSIDFSLVAKSCGAFGEKVESPAELPGALKRALSAVHSGQAAVLDVALP
jgi:acetolactate synthase-1/2/3 large subunit